MIEKILAAKIAEYGPADAVDQENVLAELMQHYVLAGLARAGFFQKAGFHGGTCLRIVHGLDRFSEDLDFVLHQADPRFSWKKYAGPVVRDLAGDGIHLEIVDRSSADSAVKKAFLKTDSIGKLIVLQLPHARHPGRKIKIKLEIDSNPPEGSDFETRYLDFPVMTAMTTQTLESSFASKSHALLCRRYTKGRDWFDFLWYVSRKIRPNVHLLQNALRQQGPWAGSDIEVVPDWFGERLAEVISEIDWSRAVDDVRRFLGPRHQPSLDLWCTELFLAQLAQLGRILTETRTRA